jgi:hypothetical protein
VAVDQLFRYAPIIGVVVLLLNALALQLRATKLARVHPELVGGYTLIVRRFLVYLGIPALVYALGSLAGLATLDSPHFHRSVFEPTEHVTWFDRLFWLIWFGILARFTFWLFLRGGAEFLVTHGELFNRFPSNATTVKVVWILMLGASFFSAFRVFAG